ncbi:MAG: SDR family oxidoreductase, partial [Phycisphaeraceae bacterium]
MLELSRTVRFCLSGDAADLATPRDNTFSAWPAMRGLGRYYELDVTCVGEADPQTGYFINIKEIDQAVREAALPLLIDRLSSDAHAAATPMGRFGTPDEVASMMLFLASDESSHCTGSLFMV